jgi:hypothetical protein
MKPGIYPCLSFAEYCKIDAVNWHTLVNFRQSAKYARSIMLAREDASDAQDCGEYTHACILEPHRLETEYAVMPSFTGHPNSGGYKAEKAAWIEAHKDKIHIDAEQKATAEKMIAAVDAHPLAFQIMRSKTAKKEISIVWVDDVTGLLCKGRIDLLDLLPVGILNKFATDPERLGVHVVDLKSTRAGTGKNLGSRDMIYCFNRHRLDYGYHGQLMYYSWGLSILKPADILPAIVAVQNAEPHDVIVCPFSPKLQEAGRQLFRKLLNQYATCKEKNKWPGVCDGPVDLEAYDSEIEETDDVE